MKMLFASIICSIILYQSHATSSIPSRDLTTDSVLGASILSASRRLAGDDDGQEDYTWLSNYSLKFQGCHHIKQWNPYAYDDEDVKIQTSRMVRYRLCPTDSCSRKSSNGCSKGYGDFVVELDTYVSGYVEAQRRQDEYECQLYVYKRCECQNNDDQDLCEYKCFMNARKYDCIENNPYYDDDVEGQGLYQNDLRDFEKYFKECTRFEWQNGNRRLEGDDYEIEYYVGSYCADQGGKIYLGMFTDDTCTNFADRNAGRSTFKKLTGGKELPFSDYSMIRSDCVSCREKNNPQDQGYYYDGDDDIRISENCQDVYQAAGKCETGMSSSSGPMYKNENACYFIEGIKIVQKDGFIDTSLTRPNKVVSFFIFLFAVSFVLLGAYIYYLRMKLGMKINLE